VGGRNSVSGCADVGVATFSGICRSRYVLSRTLLYLSRISLSHGAYLVMFRENMKDDAV
jgi:hypothetical protein